MHNNFIDLNLIQCNTINKQVSQYNSLMPSQRKRIAFLPRLEVQIIINQICKNNKLSQSKVTGILVEEALASRGVLNFHDIKSNAISNSYVKSLLKNNEKINKNDNLNYIEDYRKDEIQMINDFIDYKLFRKIMNKSKKEL